MKKTPRSLRFGAPVFQPCFSLFSSGRLSDEEEHVHQEEGREEERHRPEHVAEERRHLDAALVADGDRHEVRGVADVGHGAHEHGAHRDGHQGLGALAHQHGRIAAGEVEERQVRRRVIKERGEHARQPEEERVVEAAVGVRHEGDERREVAVVARAEHGEHRHDAAEDAEEELGDLKDRIPAEVVGFAGGLRGEQQGSAGDHDEERVAEHALEREVHAEEREVHARAPEAGHQDRADDGGEKQDVDAAVDADGLLFLGRLEAILDVAGEHEAVDREVDRKQDGAGHEPRKHQVLKRPEEAHALEEAEEERRIAERGQRAPHVGDEENEEDEGVDLAPAVLVGADERADEKHGSARRTHEVGKHGAEREDRGVHDRTTDEAAADVNAAGNDEERAHEDDERHVVGEKHVGDLVEGRVRTEDGRKRNDAAQGPEDGDLAEMMVPDVRGEQREKRDGKQNAGKRHGPRKAELGAVHVARHGGSRQQKEAGFLSRGKEIDEQEQKAGVLRRELLGYQELLEEHEGTLKVYNNKLVELRQDLQQKEIRKAELGVALERLSAEQRQAAERLGLLLDDRNQVSQEYMAARQQLTALRPQLTALEAEDAQGKQLLDDLQKQTAADHSALASIRNRLQDARVELESTAARTTMMAERMQQLDADMGRMQQELAANEDEQKHLLDVITASKTSTEQLAASSTALLAELQTVVGGKDEFGAKRIAITEKQAVAGERLDSLKKELTVAETRRNQAAMEMVRQNSDYDHALEQLATEYRITLDEARASGDLLDESDAALRRRELRLEREIETLGPVNPAAIEQYEAVSERYEFLQRQYSDLSEAKANLEAVISEINSGMAKRFKEAFGKINEYFSDCYVRLFGGGTAALKLTDPNDVLGSGIDIEVQPPGKKLQSLFLLSGGERALTVIALLFALLSYQPSPFCILDEIDAALDEANVDRFAKFLAAYAESTQFIVITHRKGTMEAAHVLHGVTMEESGVSKLLSVKLSEKE